MNELMFGRNLNVIYYDFLMGFDELWFTRIFFGDFIWDVLHDLLRIYGSNYMIY